MLQPLHIFVRPEKNFSCFTQFGKVRAAPKNQIPFVYASKSYIVLLLTVTSIKILSRSAWLLIDTNREPTLFFLDSIFFDVVLLLLLTKLNQTTPGARECGAGGIFSDREKVAGHGVVLEVETYLLCSYIDNIFKMVQELFKNYYNWSDSGLSCETLLPCGTGSP